MQTADMLTTMVSKILLVIVGVLTVNGNLADDLGQCPSFLPRTQFVKSYSDVCLYLITGKYSWNGANSNCHRHGGRLVQIQDQDKQDFINNTLTSMHWGDWGVWIGATDHDSEGTWKWTDGTRLSYGNWHQGEGPTHSGFLFSKAGYEDCALLRLNDNGRWHDYDCGTALYHHTSICEYQKVPTTTIVPTTTTMPTTTTTMPTTTTTMPTTTTTMPTTTTTMPTTTTTMPTTTTTMPTTTTTMPTTTTTMPTTTTTMPTTTTAMSTHTTTMPTTTTTMPTTTTTMPTTTTTMPTTTTTMPTTTTTMPTTTTTMSTTKTTMPTTTATMPTTTTTMPTTTKMSTTTTPSTTAQLTTKTAHGKKRKAESDNIADALVNKHDETNGGSTVIYIAIGAGSCGVVVLVAAILALVLRRRRRQSAEESSERTTNTRVNPIYDIMHGNGSVPENSFA